MLRRTARTLNAVLIHGDTSTLNAVVLDGQQPGALSLQDDMAGAAARAQRTWEQLWEITASRRAFGDFGERWLRTIAALDAWVDALAGADQLRAQEAEEALAVARRT